MKHEKTNIKSCTITHRYELLSPPSASVLAEFILHFHFFFSSFLSFLRLSTEGNHNDNGGKTWGGEEANYREADYVAQGSWLRGWCMR